MSSKFLWMFKKASCFQTLDRCAGSCSVEMICLCALVCMCVYELSVDLFGRDAVCVCVCVCVFIHIYYVCVCFA
jgi:hypothetical protein